LTIWVLLQVFFNLVAMASLLLLWLRSRLPPQDDPRMSRGLQLLQTKITVLEDLSDRTDAQVRQLSGTIEQKTRVLQNKILEAEQQMLKIDHSMNKSLQVAEIFQDKIPHQEILERQRTVEYVKAARLAHSGLSVEEIAKQVHLPSEQVELIAKFNRDQLMFDERQLPEWAARERGTADPEFALNSIDFVGGLESRIVPSPESVVHAVPAPVVVEKSEAASIMTPPTVRKITESPRPVPAANLEFKSESSIIRNEAHRVRKVIFPRIEK
jgi:hypothetical protein